MILINNNYANKINQNQIFQIMQLSLKQLINEFKFFKIDKIRCRKI